jgi:hypothetical protein
MCLLRTKLRIGGRTMRRRNGPHPSRRLLRKLLKDERYGAIPDTVGLVEVMFAAVHESGSDAVDGSTTEPRTLWAFQACEPEAPQSSPRPGRPYTQGRANGGKPQPVSV